MNGIIEAIGAIVVGLQILICAAVPIGILWTICHFVVKYW